MTGPRHVGQAFTQHRFAQIDADNMGPRALRDLTGDAGGAGGHVENATWSCSNDTGADDPIDHRPSPTTVLPKGQDFGQAVVAARQSRKERTGKDAGLTVALVHGPDCRRSSVVIGPLGA